MTGFRLWLSTAFFLAASASAWAVEPDEILMDPVLEARARAISAEVRCVVCQNETIDTSNAGIARDLRILIRERLTAGDSDTAVFAFLVARYGDFVLLRPPFKPETYLLWLAPFAIMLTGGGALAVMLVRQKKRGAITVTNLTADEERALIDVLKLEPEEGRS